MLKNKLTLEEAKERFKNFGECDHDVDHEIKTHIPNSDVVQIMCEACNKVKGQYYI